jgi:glutamate carboxypeptidase
MVWETWEERMSQLLEFAKDKLEDMLADLQHLVNMDSPTLEKGLTDQAIQFLKQRFLELTGGSVERIKQEQYGDFLRLEVGEGEEQVLLLGHVDTVWPADETLRRPFSLDHSRAYGPGIFDMKCGLIQGLYAIHALSTLNSLKKKIVFLITTDEEIGSPVSRKWIKQEAQKSKAVFVLEPSFGKQGALKTSRKGVGRFTIDIHGVAAHSGIDHQKGCSAIRELAHQIVYLEGLTDHERGTTVNVGLISGGISVNAVPDHAQAKVDVRTFSMEEANRILSMISQLKPKLPQTKVDVTGGLIRPPMEATVSRKLYHKANEFAEMLGFNLSEVSTGGASDGNFTAALGIPTLDGLGPVGSGAHTYEEFVEVSPIPQRCALVAHLILSSLQDEEPSTMDVAVKGREGYER